MERNMKWENTLRIKRRENGKGLVKPESMFMKKSSRVEKKLGALGGLFQKNKVTNYYSSALKQKN